MSSLVNKIIPIFLLCLSLPACAGGTRGTGALLDRKLMEGQDDQFTSTPSPSDFSLSGLGLFEPTCKLQSEKSELNFKVATEFGTAVLYENDGLRCRLVVPRQAQGVRIDFSDIPRGIRTLSYSRKTLACKNNREKSAKNGQAAVIKGEISMPLNKWLPESMQTFSFRNPNDPQEEILIELIPDSLGECSN